MVKATIDYSTFTGPDKANAALDDVREYLGEAKFAVLLDAARDYNFEQFEVLCGFAGIEGYPVRAMYEFANL